MLPLPSLPLRWTLVVLLLLRLGSEAHAAATRASTKPAPPTRMELSEIERWLAAEAAQPSRLGLSVAIAHNGEQVFRRGFGRRAAGDDRLVEPDTLFFIGSVTKQFTCAAILLLDEDGKLSVHDKVAKYYPHLTRAADISLLDLMNHVAGYPDYYPLDFLDRRLQAPITPDDLLQRYAGGGLDFEPGTRFSYSNTGYVLLARVAEKVSGVPLGEFLRDRIFQPLGMNHTAYEPDPSDPRLARGHARFALGAPEPVQPEAPGWLGGAGGIASTPSDLLRWNLAMADQKLLQPRSWKLMGTARTLADGRISPYGCGLSTRWERSRPVLSHDGAVSGFNACSVVIPSTRSGFAITCNLEGGLGDIPEKLLALLLDEPPRIPVVSGPSAVDTARDLFGELQTGRVNRNHYATEFNLFLTDAKIAEAAPRLRRLGRVTRAELVSRRERGGMEVSVVRLTLRNGSVKTLMYRRPDGIVEQFLVNPD